MNKTEKPVLLIGGSGVVGKWVAKHLREFHPDLPIVIGGRNLKKAEAVATEIGNAKATVVDLIRQDLGLSNYDDFSSIGLFFRDRTFNAQKFAQDKNIPFVTISGSIPVLGEDVATYVYGPQSSPVVIACHWMAGVPAILAINYAQQLKSKDNVSIIANYDPLDEYGATAEELNKEFQDLFPNDSNPLVVKDGVWAWEFDQDNIVHSNSLVDGMVRESTAASFVDILSIGAATHTKASRFALTQGESSGSKLGKRPSHNIMIEVSGEKEDGTQTTIRREIVSPNGQAFLVGFGGAIILEQLLGLVSDNQVKPGLYFPENLVSAKHLESRLKTIGVQIKEL